MTNSIVYDLETYYLDKAKPHNKTFYRLSKIAAKFTRDLTPNEIDTLVFPGEKCFSNALNFSKKYKGDERKVNNKTGEYNLQLHAHNGSGFDTWIFLNNLPCNKRIDDIIKHGKRIFSLKVFNGYIQIDSHYLIFRCGVAHLNFSIKKSVKLSNFKKNY